ncbi:hypothetical protein ACUT6V_003555 [Vibrio cholerae]
MFNMIICFDEHRFGLGHIVKFLLPSLVRLLSSGELAFTRPIHAAFRRKTTSFIASCYLISQTTAAITVSPDGLFSYSEQEVTPLIPVLELSILGSGSPFYSKPGEIVVAVAEKKTGSYYQGCYMTIPGAPIRVAEIKENDFAIVRNLLREHSDKLAYGGGGCPGLAGGEMGRLWLSILSAERDHKDYYRAYRVEVPFEGTPSTPNSCSAFLTGPLDFGVVNGGKGRKAETNVRVSCTNPATIKVTVNKGYPFLDEESGTEITFVKDGNSNGLITRGNDLCDKDCSVRVIGNMISAPSSVGTYSWHVPVIVEHQ